MKGHVRFDINPKGEGHLVGVDCDLEQIDMDGSLCLFKALASTLKLDPIDRLTMGLIIADPDACKEQRFYKDKRTGVMYDADLLDKLKERFGGQPAEGWG